MKSATKKSHQKCGLSVEVKRRQRFFALENVEPPPPLGLPRFRRLAVLDDHAVEGVGVLQQLSRNLEIRGLLVDGRFLS